MSATHQEDLLNSWKEIATYLNRGVRTAQRWEAELGMPVRRPRGLSCSAVIAMRSELDKWLKNAPIIHNTRGLQPVQAFSENPGLRTHPLIMQSWELRNHICRNRDQMRISLDKLMTTIEKMLRTRASGFYH